MSQQLDVDTPPEAGSTLAVDFDDPPFLQEPTAPVAVTPDVPLADRVADLAYRRRAAAVILLASLVLAAVALAYRGPGPADSAAGPTGGAGEGTPGGDGESAMLSSVAGALRSVSSAPGTVPTTVATTPPTSPPPPTTAPLTVPTTVATTAPTTVPPTTVPTTVATTVPPTPATRVPGFCVVWVGETTALRAWPGDDAGTVGEATFGLYPVSAVTEDRPRWYLITANQTQGWVPNDEVDRQGDCSGRGD